MYFIFIYTCRHIGIHALGFLFGYMGIVHIYNILYIYNIYIYCYILYMMRDTAEARPVPYGVPWLGANSGCRMMPWHPEIGSKPSRNGMGKVTNRGKLDMATDSLWNTIFLQGRTPIYKLFQASPGTRVWTHSHIFDGQKHVYIYITSCTCSLDQAGCDYQDSPCLLSNCRGTG